MQEEIWKDVVGYEGLYQVSSLGRVKSLPRVIRGGASKFRTLKERILKGTKNTEYSTVIMYNNGIGRAFKIHRLVAEAFITNSNNYQEVNHIDGNKHNNCSYNLEWCTHKENILHAVKNNLLLFSRPVIQLSKDGKFIHKFNSIAEASRKTDASKAGIGLVCRGKLKTSGKFKWKFATPD